MTMVKVENHNPIIMVDDSDNNLYIARRHFARSQLNNPIVTLQSGDELLKYMQGVEADRELMPALVLLDIEMPGGLSGLDTLRVLRCHTAFAIKPAIIMFTASSNPAHYEQALAWGANAFRQKPDCGKEYVAFLNSLL